MWADVGAGGCLCLGTVEVQMCTTGRMSNKHVVKCWTLVWLYMNANAKSGV